MKKLEEETLFDRFYEIRCVSSEIERRSSLYIEWIVAIHTAVMMATLHIASKIMLTRFSALLQSILFVFSMISFWWPVASLVAIFAATFVHFRTKLREYVKFVLLTTLICIFLGGWIELQSSNAELALVGVVMFLLIVRIGRTVWMEYATVQHTRQLRLGQLPLKGYYDSGNFCLEPLLALPVHFIREDVVKKHPELFEPTIYSTSITTMTTASAIPLIKPTVPLLYQGAPLTDCFFASVATKEFPLNSDILLHHYVTH